MFQCYPKVNAKTYILTKKKLNMNASNGNTVSIEYEGKLEDGTIFDSSKHGDHSHPLTFKIGEKMVIPGFEKEVLGMKTGEEKTFSIEPKDAYGEIREELKRDIPKSSLPQDYEPKEGMILMLNAPNGQQFPVRICNVKGKNVTLDLNHPLAGKKLIFRIKLLEIN